MSNRVTRAIDAMNAGTGTFEDVKEVVRTFPFGRLPQVRSMNDLADWWDFPPKVEDSFHDSVEIPFFEGQLTREQIDELRDIVRTKRDQKEDQ